MPFGFYSFDSAVEINLIENFDDSGALAELARIEKTLEGIADASDKAGKSLNESLEQGQTAAEGLGNSLAEATGEISRQSKVIEGARNANQTWAAALKNTIANQQIAGRSVGEWAAQFKGLFVQQKAAEASTGKLTVATRLFNTILKLSPIFLLIGVVASILVYFSRFEKLTRLVSGSVAAFNAVLDVLITRAVQYEEGLFAILRGDFKEGFDLLAGSVSGMGKELVDAAQNALELDQRLADLQARQVQTAAGFVRLAGDIEKLRKVAEDDTRGFGARIESANRALELQKRISAEQVDQAREGFSIVSDRYSEQQRQLEDLIRSGADLVDIEKQRALAQAERERLLPADRQAIADAEIAFLEAQQNAENEVLDIEQTLRDIRKQASEERKKQLEEERKLLAGVAKDLERLRAEAEPAGIDRDLQAVEKKYAELEAIRVKALASLAEVAKRRALSPEELAQQQELIDLQTRLQARSLEATLDVLAEYAEKDEALRVEQEERKKSLADRDLKRELEILQQRRDLGQQQIDFERVQGEGVIKQLAAAGAGETAIRQATADLNDGIRALEKQNEIDFRQRLLEVETDPARIKTILAELKVLQAELANLDIEDPAKGRKPFDLLEFLGIGNEDVRNAIRRGVDAAVAATREILEAKVKAREKARELADEEVREAEAALEKQKELAADGLANDLDNVNRELAAKKAARDQALKEEQRARRAQLLLDTSQQASSLITASANIYRSLSAIPFGTAIAVGVIAAMFGSFAIAKAKAFAAVGEAPKLRRGKRITGRTHGEGGEPWTGVDGRRYEVERNEWVIGTEPSMEHDRFLERLNSGAYRGVDLTRAVGAASGDYASPVGESANRTRELERQSGGLEVQAHYRAMVRAYREGTSRVVEAVEGIPEVHPMPDGFETVKKTPSGTVTRRFRFK